MTLTLCATSALAVGPKPAAASAVDLRVLVGDGSNWTLSLPSEEPVVFHGTVNYDQAGSGPSGMLYPAIGGPIGFFAAVLTHGVLVESTKQRQKTEMQTKADAVLEPYKAVLAAITHRRLVEGDPVVLAFANKARSADGAVPVTLPSRAPDYWRVESVPVFSMTQDQSAITLDNIVSIYPARSAVGSGEPAYRTVLRVVSTPKESTEPATLWMADEGRMLKEEVVRLYAMSIAMMFKPVAKADVWRTVRYPEGGQERIERARVIEDGCERRVIANLREWLISVPVKSTASSDADACPKTATAGAATASAAAASSNAGDPR